MRFASLPGHSLDEKPIRTLFLASGAGGLFAALLNVAWLASNGGVALIRDLEIAFLLLGKAGVPRSGFTARLAAAMPGLFNAPFDTSRLGAMLAFTATSIAVMLAVSWLLAALVAPLILLATRLTPPGFARWWWGRAFPTGTLVAFSLVGILAPVRSLMYGWGYLIPLVTIAVGAMIWMALLVACRSASGTTRFVRACVASALLALVIVCGGAGVTTLLAHTGREPASIVAGRPNILLVSIDSLRADHVHAYGYARETSPIIDGLARDGVLFRTVVSPTPWTLPAHLTLLTALPPERHGVVADGQRLRDNATFLAEVLWRAGYTTAGFVSAPYLDAVYGFSQGFDHYDDYTIAKRSFDASEQGTTSPALLRIVSEWLQRWGAGRRDRPFFAFIHMWDVHYDYTPPPPYDSMFDPDYHGTVTGENYWYGTQVHKDMDARDLEHIIALYDGEIRFTDLHLGYVLDELRNLGVLENTIVVVTADHGDEFFEHGRKGHKQDLYDESILVPLVIRFPAKVPAGRVVEDQVRLMDIAPTIIALAGLPPQPDFGPNGLQGPHAPQDLIPWITADSASALPALPAFSDLVGDAPVPVAALRARSSKFIKEQRGRGAEELYDLASDPGEHQNLLRDGSGETPLREQLAMWRSTWAGGSNLAQAMVLSDEHKERLHALGYLK